MRSVAQNWHLGWVRRDGMQRCRSTAKRANDTFRTPIRNFGRKELRAPCGTKTANMGAELCLMGRTSEIRIDK
eukprot:6118241-Pyramimonas_sp.AAC.1